MTRRTLWGSPDGEPPGNKNAAVVEAAAPDTGGQEQHQDSTRAAAAERFRKAKLAYTESIKAAIAGAPEAVAQADGALAEINAARDELRRVDEADA